jgi:hypothetical protein
MAIKFVCGPSSQMKYKAKETAARGDRNFVQETSMSRIALHTLLKDRRTFLAVGGAAAALLPISGIAFADTHHPRAVAAANRPRTREAVRTYKTSQTVAALRDVWIGHIFWVRAVSAAAIDKNEPAMKAAEQQAVANARSIAETIEPFYGSGAKDGFFKLLGGHYGAVKAYLVATVAGDGAGQSTATESLTSNADAIATFLSKANPHLPKDAVQGLLLAHGGHHIQQIQQLKDRQYEAEAQTWEEMKKHVYQIADATADALAKQFSKKFA